MTQAQERGRVSFYEAPVPGAAAIMAQPSLFQDQHLGCQPPSRRGDQGLPSLVVGFKREATVILPGTERFIKKNNKLTMLYLKASSRVSKEPGCCRSQYPPGLVLSQGPGQIWWTGTWHLIPALGRDVCSVDARLTTSFLGVSEDVAQMGGISPHPFHRWGGRGQDGRAGSFPVLLLPDPGGSSAPWTLQGRRRVALGDSQLKSHPPHPLSPGLSLPRWPLLEACFPPQQPIPH